MSYDDIIKFRANSELTSRLERIAKAHRRELPDLLRIILEDYASAEESKMGLMAMTEEGPEYKVSSAREEELGQEALKLLKTEYPSGKSKRKKAKKNPKGNAPHST